MSSSEKFIYTLWAHGINLVLIEIINMEHDAIMHIGNWLILHNGILEARGKIPKTGHKNTIIVMM